MAVTSDAVLTGLIVAVWFEDGRPWVHCDE
jgi:hypothetical protein